MEDCSSLAMETNNEGLSDEVDGVAKDSMEEDKGGEGFLVMVFPRCKTSVNEMSDESSW